MGVAINFGAGAGDLGEICRRKIDIVEISQNLCQIHTEMGWEEPEIQRLYGKVDTHVFWYPTTTLNTMIC